MSAPSSTPLDKEVQQALKTLSSVAVLGAHPDVARAAHYVPAYLHEQGVAVYPVNPRFAGQPLFGRTCTATLAELGLAIDIVDVFRPSQALMTHLSDILQMAPKPTRVWLQLGIEDSAFEQAIVDAGIAIVKNRCLMVEHRAHG
jgi:uncharacterized protein